MNLGGGGGEGRDEVLGWRRWEGVPRRCFNGGGVAGKSTDFLRLMQKRYFTFSNIILNLIKLEDIFVFIIKVF